MGSGGGCDICNEATRDFLRLRVGVRGARGTRVGGGGWGIFPCDAFRRIDLRLSVGGGAERLALRTFSPESRFSFSGRELGRFAASLRMRSRSLRISTSIRHSIAFFTSSRAYTLTPSRLPAIATRTPLCSITTTLLNATLRTRAYG